MSNKNTPIQELTPIKQFAKCLGRSSLTLWRWTKLGWIDKNEMVNISGRMFITRAGIKQFYARAKAGEFSKSLYIPKQVK